MFYEAVPMHALSLLSEIGNRNFLNMFNLERPQVDSRLKIACLSADRRNDRGKGAISRIKFGTSSEFFNQESRVVN